MYNKLICLDFDKTLFNTPTPHEGKKIWMDKTDMVWPYNGWWGKSETLDTNVFHIHMNEWVHKKYLEAVADPDAYVILATGRLEKVPNMRKNIMNILNMNNVSFDEVYLNWGGDTFNFKTKLFEELIRKLKVDELTMYDDRAEHLTKFKKWAEFRPQKIKIVDVINKKEFINI